MRVGESEERQFAGDEDGNEKFGGLWMTLGRLVVKGAVRFDGG